MPLPSALLIHSATLSHSSAETVDSYGQPVPGTASTTTVSCRFVGPHESMRMGRNVPYLVSSPRVLLPAGTAVSEGDTLTSTVLGFAGTFRVNTIKQTYEAARAVVSHITCEIGEAGATGGA